MENYGPSGTPDHPPFPVPGTPGTVPMPAGYAPGPARQPGRADLPPQPDWNLPQGVPGAAPGGGPGVMALRHADHPIGWGHPLQAPPRFIAAALLIVVAAAHLLVIEDQFDRALYLGALYAGIGAGAILAAVLLSWRDGRGVWLLAGLVAEVGAVVFVLARAVHLPQVSDDLGGWTDPLAGLALVLEVAVFGCATWAVSRSRPSVAWTASRLPLISGLIALQLGAVATFAAASVPPGEVSPSSGGSTSAYWATVLGAGRPPGVTRTYYISADEVAWNYAPTGRNVLTGKPFTDEEDVFVRTGPGRIGSTYLKCLYREYTGGTFAALKPRAPQDAYLGALGPVIRAAVGDTIKIVFRNTCDFPTSVHPHGVFYTKSSEGAPYADGTSGADVADDDVPKGGTHTYTWAVPERAGPATHDVSSVMWMYHSHSNEITNTYAGLMGPMVVTAAAQARPDGTPKDVDRELFVNFTVMNENLSPYLEQNEARFAKGRHKEDDADGFEESNLMHSINGYVYGNEPMITMRKGQHVRWYVMGMGTEVDLHTPHWHGNTLVVNGMRMDVVDLLPGGMLIGDMDPDNTGTWLFHCHVNDHIAAGMMTRYQVLP